MAQMGSCCEYVLYKLFKNYQGGYNKFRTLRRIPFIFFTITVNSMEIASKYLTHFAVAPKEIMLTPEMAYKFN